MQENNFENQVRKLMDDLQITPGEPVWEYVEKRIPKSNRRRRFIAFFLLFAGLSVCGYFFYDKFSGDKQTVSSNQAVATTEKNNDVENNATNKLAKPQESPDQPTIVADNSANKNKRETASTFDNTITKKVEKTENKNIKQVTDKSSISVSASSPLIKEDVSLSSINASKPGNNIPDHNIIKEEKLNDVKTNQPDIAASETGNDINIVKQDSNSTATALINKFDTASIAKSTIANEDESQKKKDLKKVNTNYKKLQWGVTAFYGRSNAVESFTDGIGISDPDKSYSQNATGYPGTNWDSALSASYSRVVTAKSAYSIGAVVKKQFSPRSSIRTGIQYTHINTEIKIGGQKDTTAVFDYNNSGITTRLENYYRPGLTGSHINKYNLIQIPLMYSYQLNKGKSFPVIVDGGFTLSHIFSSDALVYDSYNQAYYKNSSLINKTQITFSTGIHTALSFKHGGTIEFGPQLHYGLTNVVKNNSTSQHIFLWGLNATYFLKRK